MSAQHKMPGRSGKRARRERALERLILNGEGKSVEAENLQRNLAQPQRPIPPHQTRKLTR